MQCSLNLPLRIAAAIRRQYTAAVYKPLNRRGSAHKNYLSIGISSSALSVYYLSGMKFLAITAFAVAAVFTQKVTAFGFFGFGGVGPVMRVLVHFQIPSQAH